jgi:hypothetical protein
MWVCDRFETYLGSIFRKVYFGMYELHSPVDRYYGSDEPLSLDKARTLAESMGLDMVENFIPDGLNAYEAQHPNKAVIFNVMSEDVTMTEKEEAA